MTHPGLGGVPPSVHDFFISYNVADRDWAEWIAHTLEEAGYGVAIQAWDFRPGTNFVLDMQRAVINSKRTVLVLSPDFLASGFTAPEWAAAFAKDATGSSGTLLPVRVRPCEPTGLLAALVFIDLVGLDRTREDEARIRLLDGVALTRAKPRAAPVMPQATSAPLPDTRVLRATDASSPTLQMRRLLGPLFRFCVLSFTCALLVIAYLREVMPAWVESESGTLYSVAILWGAIAALAFEACWHLWKRRQARRSRTQQ